jgi:hypothetical protein
MPLRLRSGSLSLVFAGVLFVLAYEQGAYGLTARTIVGIAAWWACLSFAGLGLWPQERPSRIALLTAGSLTVLAGVTLASAAWAPSPENALADFNRTTLYLAVLLATMLGLRRASGRRVADGIVLGLSGICLVSLGSRLFPGVFPAAKLSDVLPSAVTRLSFPIGYWNGLALLLAIGAPLALRMALENRHQAVRAAGVGLQPAFAATVYLTSSRGGFFVYGLAVAAFVLLSSARWAASAAVATATAGAVVAIEVLRARPHLVDGPLDTASTHASGRSAALLIALVCAASGSAWAIAAAIAAESRWRPGVRMRQGALVGIALVLVLLAVMAHPVRVWSEFKTPPTAATGDAGIVQAHLLSDNGSGRWQFWSSAVREWESAPIVGTGAGSFQEWWAAHGTLPMFIRNAHSFYLETLGELGIVGLVPAVTLIGTGVFAAIRRARSTGRGRAEVAAFGASFAAYAAALGIDWIWQLTVVSLLGMVLLGALVGPATVTSPVSSAPLPRPGRPFGVGGALLVLGWLAICALMIPYLVAMRIQDSQNDVRAGRYPAALRAALDAEAIEPWAASPTLQLALVEEAIGDYAPALASVDRAIARDRLDWSLWLIKARIEAHLGHISDAGAAIDRARALNPHSPIFTETG